MRNSLIAPALIAVALPIFDATAQSGSGAYGAERAAGAQACAELCAADGLCVSWTYADTEENACSLSAVAPMTAIEPGMLSGLSPRAPDFARERRAEMLAAVDKVKTSPAQQSEQRTVLADGSEHLLGARDNAEDLPLRSRLALEPSLRR